MQGDIINCDYLAGQNNSSAVRLNMAVTTIGRAPARRAHGLTDNPQSCADVGLVRPVEGLDPSTASPIADTFFVTLIHATRAAPRRSVTQVDGQTFGEVAHGV
jgi:hypothetical protein